MHPRTALFRSIVTVASVCLALGAGLQAPASARPIDATVLEAPLLSIGPDPTMAMNPGAAFFAGDSLTFDTWHWGDLAATATRGGWAVSGVRARGGLRAWELASAWPGIAGDLPGVILVAVGANDVIHGTPAAAFRRQLQRIIRLCGDRPVALVGVSARSDPLVAQRERRLNNVMRSLARSSDRVFYSDWATVMERHPEWALPQDPFGIHLTDQGLKGRARFYVRALNRAARS